MHCGKERSKENENQSPAFPTESVGQEKQVSSVARKAANNECAQGAGWHVVA